MLKHFKQLCIGIVFLFIISAIFCLYSYADDKDADYEPGCIEYEDLSLEDEIYNSPLYSRIEMKKAYDYADRIKNIVKQKDIAALAELIKYPIQINDMEIKNQKEFIKIGSDRVFTEEFTEQVCNTELFSNYRGFMMGNSPNLWFNFIDNELKITAVHLKN